MDEMRDKYLVVNGVNLFEMPNYALMRADGGTELMEALDEWLASKNTTNYKKAETKAAKKAAALRS